MPAPSGYGGKEQKRDSERERGRSNYPISAPEGRRKRRMCHGEVILKHNYCESRDSSTRRLIVGGGMRSVFGADL